MDLKLNMKNSSNKLVLGLMSGTSCDGLDIALIDIKGYAEKTRFKFISAKNYPYSDTQKQAILKIAGASCVTAKDISQLNFYLAKLWVGMILSFLKSVALKPQDIEFIGSHGQTIWHQPQALPFADLSVSSTLQLGDPAVLAQLTGIPVIGDFRVADMALGGQGAPLIPYFDWIFFSALKENILAVNIGGISNFTLIPENGDFRSVIAFDCGPGNMLIDSAMQELFNKSFDMSGASARKGKLSQNLLNKIIKLDNFVRKAPPKSTGREEYGRQFLQKVLDSAKMEKLGANDVIHTLTEFTARSVYENYKNFISDNYTVLNVIIGGGGSHNLFLMERLQYLFKPANVKRASDYGLDDDFKEAIGFAVLANETINGSPSNVPRVTGAERQVILGKICLV